MAKRRRKTIGLAAAMAAAAAGTPGARAEPGPPAQQVAPVADDVVAALARDTVAADTYGRRLLYTWTTAAQIAELRRSDTLLLRTESPKYGASYVEHVLYALAGANDPIGKLLYREAYAKMRFAWPAPWATRAGFLDQLARDAGEAYGDQLVAVTLKPDAIVVAVSSDRGVIDARDVANRPVALADVAKAPERIAAIYFTASDRPPIAGVAAPPATYREYALCNEAMIESWSFGTAAIAREVDVDIALLERVGRAIGDARVAAAYDAALALRGPMYAKDRVGAIVKLLRATAAPRELSRSGTATFRGIGAARKPPRVRRSSSTYGTYVPKRP